MASTLPDWSERAPNERHGRLTMQSDLPVGCQRLSVWLPVRVYPARDVLYLRFVFIDIPASFDDFWPWNAPGANITVLATVILRCDPPVMRRS